MTTPVSLFANETVYGVALPLYYTGASTIFRPTRNRFSVSRIAISALEPWHNPDLFMPDPSQPDLIARHLEIRGSGLAGNFVAWIIQRANRLSLSGGVRCPNDELIEMWIVGDRVLVEAMEVACSLGPMDARVDGITSMATSGKSVLTAPCYRQSGDFVEYCAMEGD